MNNLNVDCLILIFQYLPICDKLKIERVCQKWRDISGEIWRKYKNFHDLRKQWGGDFSKVDRETFEEILKRCGKYITEIKFEEKMNYPNIKTIGELCYNLRAVNFDFFEISVDDTDLKHFFAHSKKLTSLTMMWLPDRYDDQFMKLIVFSGCRSLKYFELRYCSGVKGRCLSRLTREIEEVHLRVCSKVQLEIVGWYFTRMKNLKKLSISHWHKPTNETKEFFFNCMKQLNLESLDISNNEYFVDDDFLHQIANSCNNLKSLNISRNYFKITDQGLKSVFKLPHLEHLLMESSFRLEGKLSPHLPKLKSLVCAQNNHFTDSFFKSIFAWSKDLEFLDVRGCPNLTEKFIEAAVMSRANGKSLKIFMTQRWGMAINFDKFDVSLEPNCMDQKALITIIMFDV